MTLNLPSILIGNSNDETNFPHKSLLTNTQVSKNRKVFANGSSANAKFLKLNCLKLYNGGDFYLVHLIYLFRL